MQRIVPGLPGAMLAVGLLASCAARQIDRAGSRPIAAFPPAAGSSPVAAVPEPAALEPPVTEPSVSEQRPERRQTAEGPRLAGTTGPAAPAGAVDGAGDPRPATPLPTANGAGGERDRNPTAANDAGTGAAGPRGTAGDASPAVAAGGDGAIPAQHRPRRSGVHTDKSGTVEWARLDGDGFAAEWTVRMSSAPPSPKLRERFGWLDEYPEPEARYDLGKERVFPEEEKKKRRPSLQIEARPCLRSR